MSAVNRGDASYPRRPPRSKRDRAAKSWSPKVYLRRRPPRGARQNRPDDRAPGRPQGPAVWASFVRPRACAAAMRLVSVAACAMRERRRATQRRTVSARRAPVRRRSTQRRRPAASAAATSAATDEAGRRIGGVAEARRRAGAGEGASAAADSTVSADPLRRGFSAPGRRPAGPAPRLVADRAVRHLAQPELRERPHLVALQAHEGDEHLVAVGVVDGRATPLRLRGRGARAGFRAARACRSRRSRCAGATITFTAISRDLLRERSSAARTSGSRGP